MKYQYQVFNKNVNTIVTVPIKDEDYAIHFAKRCLLDFYNQTFVTCENLKCNFICEFHGESFINLDLLESQ